MANSYIIPSIIESLQYIDIEKEVVEIDLAGSTSFNNTTMFIFSRLFSKEFLDSILIYKTTLNRIGCDINLNLNLDDLVKCYDGSIEIILNLAVVNNNVIFESLSFYNLINIFTDKKDIRRIIYLLETLNLKSNISIILTSICNILKLSNKKYIVTQSGSKEFLFKIKTNLVIKDYSNSTATLGTLLSPNYFKVLDTFGGGIVRVGDINYGRFE